MEGPNKALATILEFAEAVRSNGVLVSLIRPAILVVETVRARAVVEWMTAE